jgi:hypothetical protein
MRPIFAYCIALGTLLLYVSFNIHNNKAPLNYRSEIYADKAGYYVYLPALFLYDFNPKKFPNKVDSVSGQGFLFVKSNPKKSNKVVFTKYPCGVAILDAPFFGITHIYCKITNQPTDGFSIPYHRMRSVSAWFYGMLGLFLVLLTLKRKTQPPTRVILLGTTLFLLGTNLIYYLVKDAGLSHNYSFFLVALLVYFKTVVFDSQKTGHYLLLGLIVGLLVLVRPINVVFVGLLVFWDLQRPRDAFLMVKANIARWLLFAGVVFLLFIPQLLYYQYAFGQYVTYAYGNETFLFWKNPKLAHVFFAFQNGWLINNPLHVFTLAGVVWMIGKKMVNGWKLLFLVLGVGLLYASWWSWELGCGFGHRGFVEFYAVLMPAFIVGFDRILGMRPMQKTLLLSLMLLFVMISLKLISAYDNCWYGDGPWDAEEWMNLLLKPVYVK